MNLQLFFSPIDLPENLANNSVGAQIQFLTNENFKIKNCDLVLIGLTDHRGAEQSQNEVGAVEKIREKFYKLKKGTGRYRIGDLGNLKSGESLEDTNARIREICEFLLGLKIVPILIGGTQDLSFGQYQAYEALPELVTLLNVDAMLDLEASGAENTTFLDKILTYTPNYLFSYNHLGHQGYLVAQDHLAVLDKLYFEAMRLGEIREHFLEVEPLIRMANLLTFDITAIRSSDAPGNLKAQPFGLSGEEACQICWYAGMNEKLSSISISEYSPALDDQHAKTASVIATMLWYFVEGYYNRKDSGKFETGEYTKYVVSQEGTDDTMIFYKSKATDKWWMLVTFGEKHSQKAYLPCSYKDYTNATHGDLPDRWIKAQAKLI
uniref:formimidoylglutamase n=1 Tax=Roseivirga sp. TaxID=1964215 RepID=UPI00404787C9